MSLHDTLPAGCEPACHGCRHRHLSHAGSLEQKSAYLARVLAEWREVLQPVATVAEGARLGYRDRVTLNARWDVAVGWRFGLMRRDELIEIPHCPVQSRRVNEFMALLRSTLPTFAEFPLAYVHVAGAQATLIVKSHRYDAVQLARLCERLPASGLEGCWVHCHPSAGRKLFARSGWHLVWGRANSIDSDGLQHGPTAFRQLLPELHAASLQEAALHLQPGPGVAVLDLYCGIGASLRAWIAAGAAALGVELGGGAIEAARLNAPAASLLRGTCVQRVPQIAGWWAAQTGPRTLYVNPPRSGIEQDLGEAIVGTLRPERIAYLSCSAGTLAKDLCRFADAGYAIDKLVPYDFFPLTHHVECLALLTRRA